MDELWGVWVWVRMRVRMLRQRLGVLWKRVRLWLCMRVCMYMWESVWRRMWMRVRVQRLVQRTLHVLMRRRRRRQDVVHGEWDLRRGDVDGDGDWDCQWLTLLAGLARVRCRALALRARSGHKVVRLVTGDLVKVLLRM